MQKLYSNDITQYIHDNIEVFYIKRLKILRSLTLNYILEHKNPYSYLFRTKHILSVETFVREALDDYLYPQEETIFGDFLEGLAIFVCSKTFNGKKVNKVGIDLEFDRDNTRYIVEIKSGPHWGNSSQIKKMIDNFNRAKQELKKTEPDLNVIAVNGCCYGRDNRPYKQKHGYYKYCGQQFWSLISNEDELYTQIIKPLGHQAKKRTDDFEEAYYQLINKLSFEFGKEFCIDGRIDWPTLVKFSSSTQTQKQK
ncbi:PmeII family type II restriction endonuclease [Anaerolineales bacterium HSG25]|nr:PmeII family type II restriction endonuclease [Anaerolineales bacterium HSG25]